MRHFQEEKLSLALFHHHLLQEFWAEALSGRALKLLRALIPLSWIIDPAPLPPGAVLDGPRIAGRSLNDWRELASASQKERDLDHQDQWLSRDRVGRTQRCAGQRLLARRMAARAWSARFSLRQRICTFSKSTKSPSASSMRCFNRSQLRMDAIESLDAGGPTSTLCPYYFVIDGKTAALGSTRHVLSARQENHPRDAGCRVATSAPRQPGASSYRLNLRHSVPRAFRSRIAVSIGDSLRWC